MAKKKRSAKRNPSVTWVSVKVPVALIEEARAVRDRVVRAGPSGLPEHLRDAIRLDVRRVGVAQVLLLGQRALAAALDQGGAP